jgi:AcrR family transcriptional regulator
MPCSCPLGGSGRCRAEVTVVEFRRASTFAVVAIPDVSRVGSRESMGVTRHSRGGTTRVQSERTRQKILRHAERLFAKRGFRGVSIREIARACRVYPNTIQHHFGPKTGLYEAVLGRWNEDVRELITSRITEGGGDSAIGESVGEMFEFLLKHHDWVVLKVRDSLGDGLPGAASRSDRSWLDFIDFSRDQNWNTRLDTDARLLLITVQGVIYNHVLAGRRYKDMFGKDLDNAALHRRVKRHVEEVVLLLSRQSVSTGRPRAGSAKKSAARLR